MWNATGTAVLALTATDVDATNQSYYGEQKLSFLAADGRNDCIVPLKAGLCTPCLSCSNVVACPGGELCV